MWPMGLLLVIKVSDKNEYFGTPLAFQTHIIIKKTVPVLSASLPDCSPSLNLLGFLPLMN